MVFEIPQERGPQRLRLDDRTEALRPCVVKKLGVIRLELGAADDDVDLLNIIGGLRGNEWVIFGMKA
jgi:hypothetical protein